MFLGTQKSLTIGGRVFTEAEITRFESGTLTTGGGIILITGVATGGRGTSFRTKAGTDFVVGAGVTLKARAIRAGIQGAGVTASYGISLGRSDAAVAFDTISPGTSPIYYGGGTATIFPLVATEKNNEAAIDWDVATGKYPFVVASGGPASCMIWCFID